MIGQAVVHYHYRGGQLPTARVQFPCGDTWVRWGTVRRELARGTWPFIANGRS